MINLACWTGGVDSILTLARRTPVTGTEAVKVLGENDLLIHWKKPKRNKKSIYSREGWEALPEKLLLRQIKVIINQSGFRSASFYIITTRLDAKSYSASELAEVYFQRWVISPFATEVKSRFMQRLYVNHSMPLFLASGTLDMAAPLSDSLKRIHKINPFQQMILQELLAKAWVDKMQSHFEWIFRLD